MFFLPFWKSTQSSEGTSAFLKNIKPQPVEQVHPLDAQVEFIEVLTADYLFVVCKKRRNPEQHGSCEVYDISHSANQLESLFLGSPSAAMQGRHWARDMLLSDTLYVECYHVQDFYINQIKKVYAT